jgi:hypothetical protein
MAGGEFNSLDASFKASKPTGSEAESNQTWFDPLIGGRLTAPGTGRWTLVLQGHVGGFGVGSDLTWQLYPVIGYRFSRVLSGFAGYRVLDIDYKSGGNETDSNFTYDVTTFGPELGIGFHF